MEDMKRQSHANCLERAHEARLQAASASDEAVKKHYTEIAEMWDHMAISIKRNGLDVIDGKPA